jgi:heme A synthase
VPTRSGFERYAWGVLGFNLLVILWGAYVRASGSGAGCGSHWPLCNGQVVPRSASVATWIELSHRLTSGLALVLVFGLVVGARRIAPPGSALRRAAWLSAALILGEALIGAGLVLLELVAQNRSLSRGIWVGGHLVNTFLLLAALALTAWYASGREAPRRPEPSLTTLGLGLGGVALLVLGAAGAITALGDTLFPPATLSDGFRQDVAPDAHPFVRLRVWHPLLAVGIGLFLILLTMGVSNPSENRDAGTLRVWLMGLYLAQIGLGVLNLWLLAPVPLQLGHLLLADLVWIAFVLLTNESLKESRSEL